MVGLAMTAMMSTPSHAAAKIQHLISPGGHRGMVRAGRYGAAGGDGFGISGGAAQDPADKSGVGNLGRRSHRRRFGRPGIPRPFMSASTAAPSS